MSEREVGQILEALKNVIEDRKEDRDGNAKLREQFNDLRRAVDGQTQTLSSIGAQLTRMETQKHEERLTIVESKVKTHDRIIGGTWQFILKLALALIGTGTFSAWLATHWK